MDWKSGWRISWGLIVGALLSTSSAWADTRDLRVEGKKPAEYVAAQTGKSYAVVIGINDYEKVRRLTYAVPDAKSVAETLDRRGFQVTTLYNQQATRRAIVSELGTTLVKRIRPEDRVVIYYAGHGEEAKVTGGKEMGYLVPVDGELDDLAGTGVSMGLIKELADALPAKQVLFLVDVCYGGIAGQQFRSLSRMTEDYLRVITRERGRQLITAGGADQQAMEGPEWGHSVFTYYLLEGLNKGHADLNSDGIIPASELYTYLNERVFSAANLKGHQQRPELWALAAEKGEFVFIKMDEAGTTAKGVSSRTDLVVSAIKAEQDLKLLVEKDGKSSETNKLSNSSRDHSEQVKNVEEARLRYDAPLEDSRAEQKVIENDLIYIPGGPFLMGAAEKDMEATRAEKPQRTVLLDGFWIHQFEVTNAQYKKFSDAVRHKAPYYIRDDRFNKPNQPVVGITWDEAKEFCRWLGMRLPTEAEWEKAARGEDGRMFPWGNDLIIDKAHLIQKATSDVGRYPQGKSIYGVSDMAGNVWEWTNDWYDWAFYTKEAEPKNPKGPPIGGEKVIRGGSWWEKKLGEVRVTVRYHQSPDKIHNNVGFRCARSDEAS